jgi:hypothetical protein
MIEERPSEEEKKQDDYYDIGRLLSDLQRLNLEQGSAAV